MDPKYQELEMDILEKYGAREPGQQVWQEMAKNPALPGDKVSHPNPEGIHPKHLKAKMEKTKKAIDAEITKVTRTGIEG